MSMIEMFTGLNLSASGLRAARLRQNVIAANIANAETTRTPEGGPYRRQVVTLRADPVEVRPYFELAGPSLRGDRTHDRHMPIPSELFVIHKDRIGSGVTVDNVGADMSPLRLVHDPGHPDADEQGYVAYPNVDIIQEMVDLIAVTRAYEANATAMNSGKAMLIRALEI